MNALLSVFPLAAGVVLAGLLVLAWVTDDGRPA